MKNDRFCCYGTYNGKSFRCLIKCRDREECERETNFLKWIKYERKEIKGEKQNGEKDIKR